MQLFSADAMIFSFFFFLPLKTLKKRPQKYLIISRMLFLRPGPNQPRIVLHIIKCREQTSVFLSLGVARGWRRFIVYVYVVTQGN